MKSCLQITALIVVCSLMGCDLGTYSKRYNERVGTMTSMANTNKDMADELIDIAGVAKIRVPKTCYYPESEKFGTDDDFLKARIPGIEIDGFVKSFLGDKEAGSGDWLPFQVYFYYVPDGKLEDVKSNIKSTVGTVMSKANAVSWDSMKVQSYDGKDYAWSTATVGATQPFLVYEGGSEKQKDLQGRMDFFVTANDQGVLTIVFRAPSAVFADEDKPLVEGTLKSIQNFQ